MTEQSIGELKSQAPFPCVVKFMYVQKDVPGRGAVNFFNFNLHFFYLQMVIKTEQMAAALTVTGTTPDEVQVRNILHILPRESNFRVQCLYHHELQVRLRILFPQLVVGREKQFNHIVAHYPWAFSLVSKT